MAKVETYNFREFMSGEYKEKKKKEKPILYAAGLGASLLLGNTQQAAASGWIEDKIINAFEPLIQLIQGISYPVCFLTISSGFILVMLGQKSAGINMIKWSCLGYIGLQFAPAIMQILVQIGKAMVVK
ncbi:hypothetical protein NST14_12020 [Bacillus sp. FSL W8-0519]|uniref:hypothetical protein n=1 Tax=Bacillus sp. FSL W8-0519 TaxID=2954624 RepID=UPI0009376FFC